LDIDRLKSEYQLLEALETNSDLIKIHPHGFSQPGVPVGYLVEYYCKGLRKDYRTGRTFVTDPIETRDPHVLLIHLPAEFPVFGPQLRMQTPIFHPNIVDPSAHSENFKKFPPGHVCYARWAPSRSLRDLVLEVGEMLQYKRHGYQKSEGVVDYLFPVPVCNEALDWVKANLSRLPLDSRNLGRFADIAIEESATEEIEIVDDDSSSQFSRTLERPAPGSDKRVCTVCGRYYSLGNERCVCGSSGWYAPRKFCLNCGRPLRDQSKFCFDCGTPTRR